MARVEDRVVDLGADLGYVADLKSEGMNQKSMSV